MASNIQLNTLVSDLAVEPDGKVLITGFFTQVNGYGIKNVARLHANGAIDTSFNPPALAGIGPGLRAVLPLSNGKILIGGSFSSIGGVSVPGGFARLYPDGSLDTTATLDLGSGAITSFGRQPNGKIVFAGSFTSVDGIQRSCLSRLLSMSSPPTFDFDGDGKTDIGVFRPGVSAEWWISRSRDSSVLSAPFGSAGDQPVPADYTGDGKTDVAFFRPATGEWFVLRSEDSSFYGFPFGSAGDMPAPADYDGDGKADPTVFRSGAWYILRSSDGGVTGVPFGVSGDKPVPADYDGDGRADVGVYRPNGASGGEWWIQKSSGGVFAATFGTSTDKTVVGDWTGDGKADCAFFRPSNNTWYVLRSEDFSFFGFPFGVSTDAPAPGDYDGDGKTDAAVFRSSGAAWFVNKSTGGVMSVSFGAAGDSPVPGSFVR
jgi:hypothetical protein